jgi:predicted aminopeptidase
MTEEEREAQGEALLAAKDARIAELEAELTEADEDNAAKVGVIDDLRAKLAQAEKDTERLDWLAAGHSIDEEWEWGSLAAVRRAIDAARKAE